MINISEHLNADSQVWVWGCVHSLPDTASCYLIKWREPKQEFLHRLSPFLPIAGWSLILECGSPTTAYILVPFPSNPSLLPGNACMLPGMLCRCQWPSHYSNSFLHSDPQWQAAEMEQDSKRHFASSQARNGCPEYWDPVHTDDNV